MSLLLFFRREEVGTGLDPEELVRPTLARRLASSCGPVERPAGHLLTSPRLASLNSGYNQAPSGADGMDDAPKSAMRVLNSMAVQAQFGKRKRGELAPSEDDGRKKKPVLAEGEGGKKKAGKVRPLPLAQVLEVQRSR